MKIEHGKFYITRGGDTVGPAYRHEGRISEETWQIGDQWYDDQGVCSTGTPFVNDVVALHVQKCKLPATGTTDASIAEGARTWAKARHAFLSLPANDPKAREALALLAHAEDVLYRLATDMQRNTEEKKS